MRPRPCGASRQRFGIPVTTTLMGIGACDTTDALSLQMLGMHGTPAANYAVEDCDFLIAVGSRFDDRVAAIPEKFAPKAKKIAHFDVDPCEIGKVKAVQWHNVGVLDRDLRQLVAWADRHKINTDFGEWHRELAALKTHLRHELRPRQPADPAELRDRGDQPAHPGRGDHHHRRRPAPDVVGAVLRLPPAPAVADVGQHGHDGLRPAGGHRRAVRRTRTSSSSTSTATPASA